MKPRRRGGRSRREKRADGEEQIAGNAGRRRLLRDDGVVLGNARKRGAAFEDLPAYAFSHMRIFSPFHGTGSALSEAVSRLASEKNRQGSNRRRRKAQAEAGGRRRERKPSGKH